MKFFQETTTDWASPTPNHVYLLTTDKSKMYGYIKKGTEDVTVFKKPYRFDARRRTFQEVRELGEIDLDEVKSEKWEFTGSKGDTYVVQKIDNMLKCSCPGFTFRGECKHVKSVEEQA
jgi:hypothetical protein